MAKRREEPVQESIEGMEDVRYTPLDRVCSTIGNIREQKNELIQDEKGAISRALKLLKEHNLTVYKHRGVELVLVPGDEKVRVRINTGGDIDQEAQEKKAKGKPAKKNGEEVH